MPLARVPFALLIPTLASLAQAAEPIAPSPRLGADLGAAVGGTVEHAIRSLRFGAYGELHYNNFQGSDSHTGQGANVTGRDMLEVHRLVLLAETQIAEHWRFVTEIEIEHAFVQNNQGELEVEQAYLDWSYLSEHSARAGMLLVPISIGNLYHEPTQFHGVERSEFDRVIVPTTWFEAGAQVNGRVVEGLDYTAGVFAGAVASGFSANQGIRGSRQRGYKSAADDVTYVGRLDWRPIPGLWLASAIAHGDADQEETFTDASFTLYTIEARFQRDGWDFAGSFGHGMIDGAENFAVTANGPIPDSFIGLSATAAYDVLRLVSDSDKKLFAFVRYENIDNQASVPSGTTADKRWQAEIIQYGITFKPNTWVVLKADYRDYQNESETAVDSWNLGVGFAF